MQFDDGVYRFNDRWTLTTLEDGWYVIDESSNDTEGPFDSLEEAHNYVYDRELT